jgi:exodeoxyribonuclease X
MQLIFLDTETTGNDVAKDRLCQICYRIGKETRTEYFKPPVPVSVKAMSITHITNKMLADKEPFIGSRMSKDLQALLSEGVLVAHNAKFDIAMLAAEGMSVPKYICTLRIARSLNSDNVIPEYNLQYLRYYLGLEVEGHPHDAESDVNVLEAVFERQLAKIMERIPNRNQAIEEMIRISEKPTLFKKINFGKYKDKGLEEVATSDPRYLEWLLAEKRKTPEMEEDWIYTLEHYLKRS